MNSEDMYVDFAKLLFGTTPTDDDALAFMILVHTHKVLLRHPFVDRPAVSEMCAITRADAAEQLAAAWPNRRDEQRTHFMYWLKRYETEVPYEVVEDVPAKTLERVQALRHRILTHSEVLNLIPED